jgi:hypothetical protein
MYDEGSIQDPGADYGGKITATKRLLTRLRGFAPRMPDFALDWDR